jgi:hypothetical protein
MQPIESAVFASTCKDCGANGKRVNTSLAASEHRTPLLAFAVVIFIAVAIGFVALAVSCVFLVRETRLALQAM